MGRACAIPGGHWKAHRSILLDISSILLLIYRVERLTLGGGLRTRNLLFERGSQLPKVYAGHLHICQLAGDV